MTESFDSFQTNWADNQLFEKHQKMPQKKVARLDSLINKNNFPLRYIDPN